MWGILRNGTFHKGSGKNSPGGLLYNTCMLRAKKVYGDPLPADISDRLEYELKIIRETGNDVRILKNAMRIRDMQVHSWEYMPRGPMSNLLVSYLMGLSGDINPVTYDLPAEIYLENLPKNGMRHVMMVQSSKGRDFLRKLCASDRELAETNMKSKGDSYIYKDELGTIISDCSMDRLSAIVDESNALMSTPSFDDREVPVAFIIPNVKDLIQKGIFARGENADYLEELLDEYPIESFYDLVRVIGFLHGTEQNQEKLLWWLRYGDVSEKWIPSSRDDVYRIFLSKCFNDKKAATEIDCMCREILKNGWNRYPVDKQFRDYFLPENLMECLSDLGMMLYHPRADDVAVALLYWRLAYYYENGGV